MLQSVLESVIEFQYESASTQQSQEAIKDYSSCSALKSIKAVAMVNHWNKKLNGIRWGMVTVCFVNQTLEVIRSAISAANSIQVGDLCYSGDIL